MTSSSGADLRVVYVMGSARSGSTVLGIALGNCPDVFYAGELDLYAREGGDPTGPENGRVPFWNGVRDRLAAAGSVARRDWHVTFEHPRSIVTGAILRRADDYRQFNADLYRAVGAEAECRFIVDSSHYPLRRWRLRKLAGVDVCTLHLVRDPAAVIESLQTDLRPKGVLGANLYLWAVHVLSELVYGLVGGRRVRIRYEDFAEHPGRELEKLAAVMGFETAELDYEQLQVGPVLAGNRVIKQSTLSLRAPEAANPSGYTRILQAPWRRRYGYGR